jgi:hypothetical protein
MINKLFQELLYGVQGTAVQEKFSTFAQISGINGKSATDLQYIITQKGSF